MPLLDKLIEKDVLPDGAIRWGIRRLLKQRLVDERPDDAAARFAKVDAFAAELRTLPVAIETKAANEQHYEVPAAFYKLCLGPRLKYSSCFYETGTESIGQAEETMLAKSCARAELQDGMEILELGCGWGSLSLWMAEHFPNSQITAVSNSRTQKQFIDARAAERGLKNLTIVTCDVNQLEFDANTRFDRAVSVEMFEHMRNYQTLLGRIASWLNPGGTLFVHIFTHHRFAYTFEVRDESDWMARYFFTGGIMPSDDLLHYFQKDLRLADHWHVDGRHYQLTSEAWLQKMDARREALMPVLAEAYGAEHATRWWVYWRVFFMSCAELFGYRGGREWLVSHYLFEKR